MWDIASIDGYDLETKYRYLGRPQRHPLSSKLWKAGELVKPMQVPQNMLGETVFLGDFGHTIRAGTSVSFKLQGPFEYCAPERFHNMNSSPASDMWSYMCIFAELYLGFTPWSGAGHNTLLTDMVNVLGPMPQQWSSSYCHGDLGDNSWYNQERQCSPGLTLESKIKR